MGEKDITEKMLEDYNDVFADIVNTLLFGEEVIAPEQLENAKDKSQFKADDGTLHEQERDVTKYWKELGIRISPNQSFPDCIFTGRTNKAIHQ